MMYLTQTVSILNKDVIPVLVAIISVGVVFRMGLKFLSSQSKDESLSEVLRKVKKPLWAGIIAIVIASMVNVIKKYFL